MISIDDLLARLTGVAKGRDGYRAECPACGTKDALTIAERQNRILFKCHRYEGACSFEAILSALKFEAKECFLEDKVKTPRPNRATAQPLLQGIDVAGFAAYRKLPVEFLKSQGVTDSKYQGSPAMRISYMDAPGHEVSVRYRVAWADDKENRVSRFRWKLGARVLSYGLWRLDQAKEQGSLLIVEGESDCWTCWHHGIAALGIPGAECFKSEWADQLSDIECIYLLKEPDGGGDALMAKVAQSAIADRVKIVQLVNHKDVSDLHCSNPEAFESSLKAALEGATQLTQILETQRSDRALRAAEGCQDLAQQSDILSFFAADLRHRGVVGEERTIKLLYLILTSRIFSRPISAAIKGPSSCGKSYTLERVLEYFPESAYLAMTGMSEHALIYDDRPISNRFLIVFEAAGADNENLSYMLRSILSEGRVSYTTVEKTSAGMKPKNILREGPTGYLTTTTRISLHPENETRMLSIPISDTNDQTERILLSIGEKDEVPPVDPAWISLQTWIGAGETRVVIPYARALMKAIPAVANRLRRDAKALTTLIKSHAILHQLDRERTADGKVIATLDDYVAVRALVLDLFSEGVGRTVQPEVRQTVNAVKGLLEVRGEGTSIRNDELARELNLDKTAASRRVSKAIDQGYLYNLEGKGKPSKIVLHEPMPEDLVILPPVEQLHGCTVEQTGNSSFSDVEATDDAWEFVA